MPVCMQSLRENYTIDFHEIFSKNLSIRPVDYRSTRRLDFKSILLLVRQLPKNRFETKFGSEIAQRVPYNMV